MRNLKLFNRKYLSIILFSLILGFNAESQEPIDIWNVEEKNVVSDSSNSENNENKNAPQNGIYEMQSQNIGVLSIEETQTLISKK